MENQRQHLKDVEKRIAIKVKVKMTSFNPKEIKIEVTHDCLLNCVHCSSMSKKESGANMEWSVFERILDEAKDMGVKEINEIDEDS